MDLGGNSLVDNIDSEFKAKSWPTPTGTYTKYSRSIVVLSVGPDLALPDLLLDPFDPDLFFQLSLGDQLSIPIFWQLYLPSEFIFGANYKRMRTG